MLLPSVVLRRKKPELSMELLSTKTVGAMSATMLAPHRGSQTLAKRSKKQLAALQKENQSALRRVLQAVCNGKKLTAASIPA